MYEHYRNDLISELSETMSQESLSLVLKAIDKVSARYEITEVYLDSVSKLVC